MGIIGEIELCIVGGDTPVANVRFTANPLIEVRTSATKVTWGSLTLPLQEAVSAEIEQHALGLLRSKLNPPGIVSLPLGDISTLNPKP